MESTGTPAVKTVELRSTVANRPVISDRWAAKVDSSTVVRLVCFAWLAPAISMIWIGFAAVGLRSSTSRGMNIAFDRVQAMVMLLTIFGLLIGLSWAVRVWTYLPAVSRIGSGRGRPGPASHAVAAVVSGSAVLLAGLVESGQAVLVSVAALSGCYAVSLAGRWVLMAPVCAPFPIAMLTFGSGFQVTIGWLHAADPAGALAPLLMAEGLILAWMAVAAGRAVAEIAAVQAASVHPSSVLTGAALGGPALDSSPQSGVALAGSLAQNSASRARMTEGEPQPQPQPEPQPQPAPDPEAEEFVIAAEGPSTQVPALPPLRAPAVGH